MDRAWIRPLFRRAWCRFFDQRLPDVAALLSSWFIAAEGLAEDVDRLFERRARSGRFAKRVEHEEVVDDAVEPDAGCAHPGFDELARVGLPFVAQDVVLVDDHERFGQASELVEA